MSGTALHGSLNSKHFNITRLEMWHVTENLGVLDFCDIAHICCLVVLTLFSKILLL